MSGINNMKTLEIEYPTDSDIEKAILEMEDMLLEDIRLEIGDTWIDVFTNEKSYHVCFRKPGKLLECKDASVTKETVITILQLFNKRDSSWKNMVKWVDITNEIKPFSFVTYVANASILIGFFFLFMAFIISYKILVHIYFSLGIAFPLLGVVLHFVWYWAGRNSGQVKSYPILLITKNKDLSP